MNDANQPTGHEEFSDLCAGHALGALDPPESARLEAHLREGCQTCPAEIAAYGDCVAALADLRAEKTPPASAEDRVFERIGKPGAVRPASTLPPAPARRAWQWLPAAASFVLVVAAIGFAVHSRAEAIRLEKRAEEAERDSKAHETATDPIVSIFDPEPYPAARGARARATFDPRTSILRVYVHELQPPPKGETYHGWLLAPDGIRDMGAFGPDETSHATLMLQLAGRPSPVHIRITVGSAGASDGPGGTLVFEYSESGSAGD